MLTLAPGEVSSLSQNTSFVPPCNKKTRLAEYFFITASRLL